MPTRSHITCLYRALPLVALLALACGASAAPSLDDCAQSLADGMYPVAEQYLVQYLAANRPLASTPEYQRALSMLCHALSAQGRASEVISLLDRNADIVALSESPRRFDYWRAQSLFKLGRIDEALAIAATTDGDAPATNGVYELQLMRVAADAYASYDTPENDEKAMKTLDALFAGAAGLQVPVDGARFLQSRILLRRGETAKAGAMLDSLSSDTNADRRVRAAALVKLVELSATNSSASVRFSEALARLPLGKDASSYLIPCGRLLISRHDTIPEGAAMLKRAIRATPSSPEAPDAQYALAEAWLSAGSNEVAAAEFMAYRETYGQTSGKAPQAAAGQATALFGISKFDEAATLFQKAARESTGAFFSASCTLLAGESLLAAGLNSSAIGVLEKVFTAVDVADSDGLEVLVRIHPSVAVDDAPLFVSRRAKLSAADALERSGETARALALYEESADGDDRYGLADTALYRSALLTERTLRDVTGGRIAMERYSLLAEKTSDARLRALALLGRGRIRYAHKTLSSAIADFMEVEKAGFESAAEARLYRIYALYGLGRDDEALAAAEEALASDDGQATLPTLSLWLGQYRYNEGDMAKAEEIFAGFADRWPDDERAPSAILWAARAALAQSENQRVVERLASLGERYSGSTEIQEARLVQATALCNLARFEDAVLVLDDAILKFPAGEFATRLLILKGDAMFALSGSSKMSVTNACAAYAAAASRTDATPSDRLECGYKYARCLEKGGDPDSACRQYYENVVLPYLQLGGSATPADGAFFESAANAAARIKESRGDVDGAMELFGRVAESGLPGAGAARREMARLRNGGGEQ